MVTFFRQLFRCHAVSEGCRAEGQRAADLSAALFLSYRGYATSTTDPARLRVENGR
jgi:hypothetical protein